MPLLQWLPLFRAAGHPDPPRAKAIYAHLRHHRRKPVGEIFVMAFDQLYAQGFQIGEELGGVLDKLLFQSRSLPECLLPDIAA